MSRNDVSKATDAQLIARWAAIDSERVKRGPNKGCVTLRAAKLGDLILAEAKKRGLRL